MADDAEEAAAPVQRGGSKLITLLLLVNVAATAAVAFRVFTFSPAAPPPEPQGEGADQGEQLALPGPVHTLDPFIVNLNEPAGARFLKVVLDLQLADQDAATVLEQEKRAVRDRLLSYLSNLRVADTMGEENKKKIKEEVLARVSDKLGQDKVKEIYLAEFVVQ